MRLYSTRLDYTPLNVESNWTHKRGFPRGRLDMHGGLWELYWKPLRKQDISDHREQKRRLKNEEKRRENETLQA